MRQFAGAFFLAALSVSAVVLPISAAHAQSQMVRVTVPKANVRSEPSDKAPILQQATANDQIEWRATEGDWFKVLMPPNPALGGARVEAYISKKVSKLETAAAMPLATPVEPPPAAVPKAGMHLANMLLGSGSETKLVQETPVQMLPDGDRQAWVVERADNWPAIDEKRPSFTLSIGDQAGFTRKDVAPGMVRLGPAPAGSAGLLVQTTKDGKDWKGDFVGVFVDDATSGIIKFQPGRDLKPGDYAIILRMMKESRDVGVKAWAFTVK
jgi:hypothetical protein